MCNDTDGERIIVKERAKIVIIALRSDLVEVLLLGNGGALVQG